MSIYAAPCEGIDISSCDYRDELRQLKREISRLESQIIRAEVENERKQERVNELQKRAGCVAILQAYREYHLN